MAIRIIIAGGRDFDDYGLLKDNCDRIIENLEIRHIESKIEIISGDASGADTYGSIYAAEKGYPCIHKPANWKEFGKVAGFIRNREMAITATETGNFGVLIAFWDGSSAGTKNMIEYAKQYDMKVFVIPYS